MGEGWVGSWEREGGSMTRQPSDSLLIDRVPPSSAKFVRDYRKQMRQAKKEGPQKCSVEGCVTNVRGENRERGVCEACWRRKMNP